ncbi:MAG: selenocysteine-specific translation elongation factor [Deltaproteobacteria bacterium]|nr:selenocysteine-specific translation elongation factor [Deltaproteobacteria bacterium]
MKHIILGTAGHVDHGKTALIKALTGIDTDRLKEEKERGITIELGFAQFMLPSGQQIGIIDVPGHERFVKNMVAGAGGIDVVAMVIAADEGIMPQTAEHLNICRLLGIRKGIVALTKIDLVDTDWLDLVTEDVREFLEGTFLEGAPIIPLSAVTGIGLTDFTSTLEQVIAATDERSDTGFFRLPIDRVFTMKGFGTVVTGTLTSGKVSVGDTIDIMPHGSKAKIRGIQIHGKADESAVAGQRTAMNLQGIDREALNRGDVLTTPDTFEPSLRLDIALHYLATSGKKLKNRAPVRFHIGTSEIMSRIILHDRTEIEPGEDVYAQILLESPAVAMADDRFVIRSYSPITTIGGGTILDPVAKKYRRSLDHAFDQLPLLKNGSTVEKTKVIIDRAGLRGITGRRLAVRTGIPPTGQTKILEDLFSRKEALLLDRDQLSVVSYHAYQRLQGAIIRDTVSYHKLFPLKEGYPKEELRITIGRYIDVKLFNRAVRDLEKEGAITVEKDLIRIPDHRVNLKGELDELRNEIEAIYRNAELTPPSWKELAERYLHRKRELDNVVSVMLQEGILVKINEDMYFHILPFTRLKNDYREFLVRNETATPALFRDLTGLSRKYTIPLMEYFDRTKMTIRVGDHRVLRERTSDESSK